MNTESFSFVDAPSRVGTESVRVERGESETVTVAVVRAVESLRGSLDPGELYEAVEPEALNGLFADRPDGTPRLGGEITFTVAGCVVTVRDGEEIIVEQL